AEEPGARTRDVAELRALLEAVGRGGEGAPPAPRPPLGSTEHDIISVVMPGGAGGAEPEVSTRGLTRATLGVAPDLRVRELASGARVVTVAGRAGPADQAARAARVALELRAADPSASIAVATGPGLVALQLPVGDVLDDAA